MLDIAEIRANREQVRVNLQKRGDPQVVMLFEEVITNDELWRRLKAKVDEARARRNKVSQEINQKKKAGKDAKALIGEAGELARMLGESEEELERLKGKIHDALLRIPNIMHESVPVGKDDSENVVVKTYGKKPAFSFDPKSHVDLLEKNDWVDTERAAKISGSRWYFLKGDLVLLEMALSRYALDFLAKKGFVPIVPPFMMTHEAYEGVTNLDDFENVMYKVEDDNLHAIATSEHPLTAMFMNEVLAEECLPIKYAGYSTNFRKEAGTHGKDEKGIFRVHQFNKVEQLIVCKPEESWDFHEQLLINSVEFFESLGLHFNVVNVCTGDLGIVAAKKYDVEAWYPVQGEYREVVSCSNCTSYQANRLNIRYQAGKERKKVHTLNSTCVATARTLAIVLETFQNEDGSVRVPKVLQPYLGKEVIGGRN